jgi:catechol 2,3-dioxygenase-like lactoylglutathione lyase family enzyme
LTIRRVVPNFRSSNPAASRPFYEGVLGLELGMDIGWIVTFVSPDNPTAQVSLIRADATSPVHPDASVEVVDVEAAHEKAVEQGCEIVYPLTDEPWGVRRFFVRDPNGAVINVMTHLRQQGGGDSASP